MELGLERKSFNKKLNNDAILEIPFEPNPNCKKMKKKISQK